MTRQGTEGSRMRTTSMDVGAPWDAETSSIRVHTTEILPGRHEHRFEWVGPTNAPVRITLPALRYVAPEINYPREAPAVLNCFPWPLRKVSDHDYFLTQAATYVRTDGANVFSFIGHRIASDARIAYRKIRMRLIYTAMVWGWADVPIGDEPGWRHLGRKRN